MVLLSPDASGIEQFGPKFEEHLLLGGGWHQHYHPSADWIEVAQLAKAIGLSGRVAALPSGSLEACDGTTASFRDHNVPLHLQPRPRPWALGKIGGQHYPKDFAVVAFDDISGLKSSSGAIAAGDSVTLEHFAILQHPPRGVALVVGGDALLSRGKVQGDIRHGGALAMEHTLHFGSAVADNPVPFETLERRLQELSRFLLELEPNGTVSVNDAGKLFLSGRSKKLEHRDDRCSPLPTRAQAFDRRSPGRWRTSQRTWTQRVD